MCHWGVSFGDIKESNKCEGIQENYGISTLIFEKCVINLFVIGKEISEN